jgi:hypothetical protein
MRPSKSGNYWWLNNKGKFEIAVVYVDEDESDPANYLSDMVSRMSIRELEKTTRFKRWIGPAHPPNLEPTTVHEMVSQWIARNGADGLCNEEGPCGCDGSAPCGDGPYPECEAAMAGGPGIDVDGQEVDVLYYPIQIKSGDNND